MKLSGDKENPPSVTPAEDRGRSQTESRPVDPEALSREELAQEVRRLRAELAARAHMTVIDSIDEATASRRLAALEDAIAAMPVGFVLFDQNDRLLFKNNRFQFYDSDGMRDRLGTSFEELLRFGIELGMYPDAGDDPDGWIETRLAAHRAPTERIVQETRDGRFIQIEEKRLNCGGTVGTYTDVSQIKMAEDLRDRAFEEVERASRAKSTFLANMGHELRTPLNAIIGFTQLLLSDRAEMIDAERRREYLQDIEFSAKHLTSIISDILDISRVETGQYRITKQRLAVADICEQVCRLFQRQALDQGTELVVSIGPDDPVHVAADQRALHQMLINLVSNAIRHSGAEQRIEIGSRLKGDEVQLWVRDQGPGIAAEELPEVVKPFYRSSRNTEPDDAGLGLGLALTHLLMELHGGRLLLESEVGRGTTATLSFLQADLGEIERASADSPPAAAS